MGRRGRRRERSPNLADRLASERVSEWSFGGLEIWGGIARGTISGKGWLIGRLCGICGRGSEFLEVGRRAGHSVGKYAHRVILV